MAAKQASKSSSLGFPAKGSLQRVPFPRLVREIAKRKLTGSLYLLSGDMKKVVFFEKGQPVFVRSNVLSECLGQILAAEGLVTHEQCEQTLEAIRRTGKRQGELLVEMGILSDGNLRYALEAQLRYKLYDVFSWTEGRFQFKPGASEQDFAIRLGASAEGVIVAAIQESYSDSRATALLEPDMERFPVAAKGSKDDGLNLLAEESYFLSCLDGSRSTAEVLKEPPEPAPPTPAALLYGLIQAGLATLSSERSDAKPSPDPPDLQASDRSDGEFVPLFDATNAVTEYEDTPLPGELPSAPEPLGDHADDFDGVASDDSSEVSRAEALVELLAAEERLQDEIGFLEDDDELELLEDDVVMLDDEELAAEEELDGLLEGLDLDAEQKELDALEQRQEERDLEDLLEEGAPNSILEASEEISLGLPVQDEADLDAIPLKAAHDDLLDLDDIDNVDLEPDDDLVIGSEESADDSVAGEEEVEDAEILAAMRFNEGEVALENGDYEAAVGLLEAAYEHGFDVAELHAMLAYARFMAAGQDPATADQVLELLGYAEEINPSLDLVHAYRGAVFRAIGEPAKARTALERALQLNPYCELAMETMDSLG